LDAIRLSSRGLFRLNARNLYSNLMPLNGTILYSSVHKIAKQVAKASFLSFGILTSLLQKPLYKTLVPLFLPKSNPKFTSQNKLFENRIKRNKFV
jgi:hypothetical protein